jgi:hypothetical protein
VNKGEGGVRNEGGGREGERERERETVKEEIFLIIRLEGVTTMTDSVDGGGNASYKEGGGGGAKEENRKKGWGGGRQGKKEPYFWEGPFSSLSLAPSCPCLLPSECWEGGHSSHSLRPLYTMGGKFPVLMRFKKKGDEMREGVGGTDVD